MQNKKEKKQLGFTLVEIIAVLVILGILAAVAVPKYNDLQEEARKKSAQAAIAEIKGRYSIAYGKYLLQHNGLPPTSVASILADATAQDVGNDYTVTIDGSGGATVTIRVTAVQNSTLTSEVNGTWTIPSPIS